MVLDCGRLHYLQFVVWKLVWRSIIMFRRRKTRLLQWTQLCYCHHQHCSLHPQLHRPRNVQAGAFVLGDCNSALLVASLMIVWYMIDHGYPGVLIASGALIIGQFLLFLWDVKILQGEAPN
uniref:Solute carrier family 40 protein n=1 Tax=Ditylenchus dipsaci TaxID=166011 RepID=A0A915CWN9_9BILA